MRLRSSLSIPTPIPLLMLCSVLVAGCSGKPFSTSPPLDFGDMSVGNLWYQVDTRKRAGDLDQALIYADKLIELYSAEALEEQASLSDYPLNENVYKYETLNYVGLALLVKGDMLKEQGDNAGAREAYNTLIRDFSYAQHGTKDEYFKVAEDAKERLEELNAEEGV